MYEKKGIFFFLPAFSVSVFVEQLTEIKKRIFEKMNVNRPMDEYTYEQKTEFRNATHCSICKKEFQPDDTKVQDHCHFTGKYRGAAHVKCNLDYSFRYFKIPIFLHNLKHYDAHLIIAKTHELNIELNQNKKIDVIAQNSEKFITFSFGACQFKDSFAFLTSFPLSARSSRRLRPHRDMGKPRVTTSDKNSGRLLFGKPTMPVPGFNQP